MWKFFSSLMCGSALITNLAACDSASTSDKPAEAGAAAAVAGSPGAAAPAGKGRGSATVTMDGAPWAAERCTARIKADDGGEKLTLACSRSRSADGGVQSEELKLVVKGYKGPGDYKDVGNSHFARVTVDTKAANAAPDEDARDAVMVDSLAGSKVVLIQRATVTITAATEAAIDGTFAWTPEDGKEGPVLADGKFHAVVRR